MKTAQVSSFKSTCLTGGYVNKLKRVSCSGTANTNLKMRTLFPPPSCICSRNPFNKVAVACGAETVLAAMIHPRWVAACMLDAPDESEAQLTALDLAARPPAKLNMLKCLLACGATPTARTVLSLVRNCGEGCGDSDGGRGRGLSLVQECFLGAVAASEWASNPLVPGLNLSVALIEARRQVSDYGRSHRVEILGMLGELFLLSTVFVV